MILDPTYLFIHNTNDEINVCYIARILHSKSNSSSWGLDCAFLYLPLAHLFITDFRYHISCFYYS